MNRSPATRPAPPPPAAISAAALAGFGACLLLACLIGILARPTGFLSSFWPANAVLLGLVLRLPQLAHWKAWAVALAVFVLTDLVTGNTLPAALWLSAANLSGAACGWWYLHRLDTPRLRLRRQTSALYLLMGCAIGAMASSLVGAGTGPLLFGTLWPVSFMMWFSTELMNSVLIVPLILSAPSYRKLRALPWRTSLPKLLPMLSVLVAEAAALLIGGPGALTFAVPALLWCAQAYSLFTTTVLSLLVCTWKVAAMSLWVLDFIPSNLQAVVSLRLGLTLLSLGPLAVACAQTARNELLRSLDHAVSHDFLTQALARSAFLARGESLLARLRVRAQPSAILMLDIDYFKQVNDHHGHPAGDALLRAFARTLGQVIRPQDLLGRMGGEEFAIVLPDVGFANAQQIATRLCTAVRAQRLTLDDGTVLQVTVSIGLHWSGDSQETLETSLAQADKALYQAKAAGRDGWQALGGPMPALMAATAATAAS